MHVGVSLVERRYQDKNNLNSIEKNVLLKYESRQHE